jgi:hypothetical protein
MGIEDDPVVSLPGAPTTPPTARITVDPGRKGGPESDPVADVPGIGPVVSGSGLALPPTAVDQALAIQSSKNAGLGALQGATLGQYPRIAGGIEALIGTAPSYNAGLQKHLEYLANAEREDPYKYMAGEMLGGAATGALTGSIVPRLAVGAGAGRAGRALAGGLTDALTGGAQGAGTTYSGDPDEIKANATMGGVFGFGLGIPSRIVGHAGGGIAGNLASDIPPSMTRAGRIADPDVNRLLSNMYPRSMMVDAGPAMETQGKAAVLGTGPNALALRTDLERRNNTVNRTLADQAQQAFGPPLASPRIVQDQLDTQIRPQVSQLYRNAFAGPGVQPVDVTRTAAYLDQAILDSTDSTLLGTLRRARTALDDPLTGGLTADPERLHSARSTINRILRERDNTGQPALTDPNTRRLLANTQQRMTDELNAKVPGIQQIDSMRSELGRQRNALDFNSPGARIFNPPGRNYVSPEEMDRILQNAANPSGTNTSTAEPFRLQQAANFQLHSKLGQKNRLTAAENLFGKEEPHPANVEKASLMFGDRPTQDFLNAKNMERAQRDVYTNVLGGSQTAGRLAAAKAAADKDSVYDFVKNLVTGRIPATIRSAGDYFSRARGEVANERIAGMLRANTPQGIATNQDILLQALRDRTAAQKNARYLLQGGLQGGASAGIIPKQIETVGY